MKVILLQDVAKVGQRGAVAEVKPGFAQNFLFPRGLAEVATPAKEQAALKFQEDRAQAAQENQEALQSALSGLKQAVTITEKANEQGHLFEGVHTDAIAKAVGTAVQLEVPASVFTLKNPIKELGTHDVVATVGEWSGKVKVEIVAE